MKQSIRDLLKNETFVATLLILFTTLITYGVSIPNLGYYHDDWFVLWSGQARGAESLVPLFLAEVLLLILFFVYHQRSPGEPSRDQRLAEK